MASASPVQIDRSHSQVIPALARASGRGGVPNPPHKRTRREALADGQLVTLALNGDTRAFPILMARYEGKIRGLIARRVRSPEDAADLAQDTLASAWSALQTYPATHPFETWLVCIALNKCRDWGRRRAVRQRAAPYLPELGPEAPAGAEQHLVEAEALTEFLEALARLPQALREPLVLTALNDLSQRDAAAKLGITVKGVETRVRRAKLWLREALGGDAALAAAI